MFVFLIMFAVVGAGAGAGWVSGGGGDVVGGGGCCWLFVCCRAGSCCNVDVIVDIVCVGFGCDYYT